MTDNRAETGTVTTLKCVFCGAVATRNGGSGGVEIDVCSRCIPQSPTDGDADDE